MAFLAGCRVLDFSDARGLMAGRLLADLGADVVQVEPPQGSDARRREPRCGNDPASTSYLWLAFAANKRGIVLDLETPEGRGQALGLIDRADILIESRGPGRMEAYGLGWEQIKATFPRLVYVSITPFGRTGPKANYADSDLVMWAAGGPLDPHRDGTGVPLRPSVPQAYRQAAADAAAGALLALLARNRTGSGQLVDVAVQGALGTSTLGMVLAHAVGDVPRDRAGKPLDRIDQSGSGSGLPANMKKWKAADGLIEFHLGIGPAAGAFTGKFFRWMLDDGEPVERFAGLDWRQVPTMMERGQFTSANLEQARSAVARFLSGKTKRQVLDAAVERKLLAVPIYTTADLIHSDQLEQRGFYATLGEGDRAVKLPGPAMKVSIDAFDLRRPAPEIGEHTSEVLAEWDVSNEPVAREHAR